MTVIGLISDTHGRLPDEALAAMADVDHIIHAGDIGGPEILHALEALAPTTAVLGNNDFDEYGSRVGRFAHPVRALPRGALSARRANRVQRLRGSGGGRSHPAGVRPRAHACARAGVRTRGASGIVRRLPRRAVPASRRVSEVHGPHAGG